MRSSPENKNRSTDEKLQQRFYILNAVVAVILLAAIFISISQFGAEAWHGRQQIALVIPEKKEELGWNKSQYLAIKSVCDELNCDLILRENVLGDYDSCKNVLAELTKRGVNSVYFSNGCHLYDVAKLEIEYPKAAICTFESISALWTGGRYEVLSFEGSYLAGILAGLNTKTNKIGYVAPFMDPEINQGINAFTLGVQRVKPEAEVLLNWSGRWNNPSTEEQAVRNLKALNVDVLTYHQNGDTIPNSCERVGINFIAFNEVYPSHIHYLASIKIDWKAIYDKLFMYKNTYVANGAYAFGMIDNIVDFEVSNKISTREKVLIDTAKWEIENGRMIFGGEIFDSTGNQRCAANETISFNSLYKNMNWLVRGVKIVGN